MLLMNQHPHNKSIMVSVIGVPNVGKSSLINTMMGFDFTIVSPKPQTTRNAYHAVVTIDHTEIIFVDTPGLHKAKKELNRRMNGQAIEGGEECDLQIVLLDATKNLAQQLSELKQHLPENIQNVWIVVNKVDLVPDFFALNDGQKKDLMVALKMEIKTASKLFLISAKTEENIHLLTQAICEAAQPGPHLYGGGQMSNKNERFFVGEYIREQAFEILKDELPYELAVVIEEFKYSKKRAREEQSHNHLSHNHLSHNHLSHNHLSHNHLSALENKQAMLESARDDEKRAEDHGRISASLLVNRPSQRAIVVGKQGAVIRSIGIGARHKIEKFLGTKVFLNLHVKVSPKWFTNNAILEELGLPRVKDSTRVWHKKDYHHV
jgi:GTP-binding protein Era